MIIFLSAVSLLFVWAAALTLWAPVPKWVRLSAVGIMPVAFGLALAGTVELPSRPKPVDLEWWNRAAPHAEVLDYRIDEGEGIYLWLQLPGVPEPRYYVIPWDDDTMETAQELHEASQEAEKRGLPVTMLRPFEPSLDPEERMFHAPPPEANPPKRGTS